MKAPKCVTLVITPSKIMLGCKSSKLLTLSLNLARRKFPPRVASRLAKLRDDVDDRRNAELTVDKLLRLELLAEGCAADQEPWCRRSVARPCD